MIARVNELGTANIPAHQTDKRQDKNNHVIDDFEQSAVHSFIIYPGVITQRYIIRKLMMGSIALQQLTR